MPEQPCALLNWREVQQITGVSRTSADRWERAGTFPRRVRIGPGRVAWHRSEVVAWLANLQPAAKQETDQ